MDAYNFSEDLTDHFSSNGSAMSLDASTGSVSSGSVSPVVDLGFGLPPTAAGLDVEMDVEMNDAAGAMMPGSMLGSLEELRPLPMDALQHEFREPVPAGSLMLHHEPDDLHAPMLSAPHDSGVMVPMMHESPVPVADVYSLPTHPRAPSPAPQPAPEPQQAKAQAKPPSPSKTKRKPGRPRKQSTAGKAKSKASAKSKPTGRRPGRPRKDSTASKASKAAAAAAASATASSSSSSASSTPRGQGTKRKAGSLSSTSPPGKTVTISEEAKERNMSEKELLEYKRKQRLMRNRKSAQLSRDRKKRYVTGLETQVKELTAANKSLEQKLEQVLLENKSLRERMEALEAAPRAGAMSPMASSPAGADPEDGSFPPFWMPGTEANRLVSSGAEDSDSLSSSGPGSPVGPDVKRQRVGSRQRVGMLLFALTFSFGVFYAFVGLDLNGNPRLSHAQLQQLQGLGVDPSAPEFRGRVLSSINALAKQQPSVPLASIGEKQQSKVVAVLHDEEAAIESAAPRPAKKAKTASSAPSASSSSHNNLRALVSVPKQHQQQQPSRDSEGDVRMSPVSVSSTDDDSDNELFAVDEDDDSSHDASKQDHVHLLDDSHLRQLAQRLASKVRDANMSSSFAAAALPPAGAGRKEVMPIVLNSESGNPARDHAVQIYQENEQRIQHSLTRALSMYKQMLMQHNATFEPTDLPMSIMFCPSPVHIQPQMFSQQGRAASHSSKPNASVVSYGGSKKLLDGPNATGTADAQQAVDLSKMLLWVPSTALAADFHASSGSGTFPPRDADDITELTVKVAGVRRVRS